MNYSRIFTLIISFVCFNSVCAEGITIEEKQFIIDWQQSTFDSASASVQEFIREIMNLEIVEAQHVLNTTQAVLNDLEIPKEKLMKSVLKATKMGVAQKLYKNEIPASLLKELSKTLEPLSPLQDDIVERMLGSMKLQVELWFSENPNKVDLLKLYSEHLQQAIDDYQFLHEQIQKVCVTYKQ